MKKQFKVLYAEDNEDACFMLETLFGFSDIEVKSAYTVAEAWQLAHTEDFDLYVLDTQFSVESGLKLCRQLREFAPNMPIFFYSGNAREIDKAEGLAAGGDLFITKPHSDVLLSAVQQLIIEPAKHQPQVVRFSDFNLSSTIY